MIYCLTTVQDEMCHGEHHAPNRYAKSLLRSVAGDAGLVVDSDKLAQPVSSLYICR